MADAAVEFLLENLKQLLVYNANLIVGVKDEVEFLYNDLDLFKALLNEASAKRSKNEIINKLVKQIRNIVHDAEDAVDTFVTHAAVHRSHGCFEKAFHTFNYSEKLHTAGKEIQLIRGKVKGIYEMKNFWFDAIRIGEGPDGSTMKKKAPVVEKDNVVGFEEDVKKVINLLTEGSDDLEVVSIVGMAGLGKTTLARMIYRHPKIEGNYYNRVWVYVSQEYKRKEVFLNILAHFTHLTDAMHKMNEDNLAKEIGICLENENYLIIVDDVWSKEVWVDLKNVFPNNNKRSRILITSQIEKIAKHASPNKNPYCMRSLNTYASWTLLQLKALGEEICPPEFERDGRHIANECKGLPLALVVIGGILLEKGKDCWSTVAESVDAYFAMDPEKQMENCIALSYNHLPYHLKSCFIYFGIFPKDFKIPVSKLVRLWIAEGFILSNDRMSLEDIAVEYLDNLVNRNLVIVEKRRLNGKIKTCRVHDMLREFCKNKAAEDNFFKEIKQFNKGTYASANPSSNTHRRLCIHNCALDYISSKPVGPKVRSLVFSDNDKITLPDEHHSSFLGAFKLLRVFDSGVMAFTRFPMHLTQLIHLRYISLSGDFNILPTDISSLWNIQTFVVETTSRTLDVKADIWMMFQLRHIKTNAAISLPRPRSKSKNDDALILGNLQTLSNIAPESCTEDVFSRTPNLKKLGIRGQLSKLLIEKSRSMLFDSLGKLSNVESLKLLNDASPLSAFQGKLDSLPREYKFPTKLKKLTLSNTLLDWKYMSTLKLLINLEILKLKDNAFKGEWWQCDVGFRALRVLYIDTTDLMTWKASADHFQRLRQLVLRHCNKLEAIPSSFGEVSSLELVDLYETTSSAAASARIIQNVRSTRAVEFKISIYPADQ